MDDLAEGYKVASVCQILELWVGDSRQEIRGNDRREIEVSFASSSSQCNPMINRLPQIATGVAVPERCYSWIHLPEAGCHLQDALRIPWSLPLSPGEHQREAAAFKVGIEPKNHAHLQKECALLGKCLDKLD